MIPVLVIGKSGAGKSASLRNMPEIGTVVVNVLGKPLPFKSNQKVIHCNDYGVIAQAIQGARFERCIIDDFGYLMTAQFMSALAARGKGGDVFGMYTDLGNNVWTLVKAILDHPSNARVYLIMHEEQDDYGNVKPRAFGKLVEQKVCIEGMVSICLRAMTSGGRHVFRTQSDGYDVAKSPMGMFAAEEIDNDLAIVDEAIVEYYGLKKGENEE